MAGREFRQPAYLATSFSKKTADGFMRRSKLKSKVRWLIRIDPQRKCVHVNLVKKSNVPGEKRAQCCAWGWVYATVFRLCNNTNLEIFDMCLCRRRGIPLRALLSVHRGQSSLAPWHGHRPTYRGAARSGGQQGGARGPASSAMVLNKLAELVIGHLGAAMRARANDCNSENLLWARITQRARIESQPRQ